MLRMLGTLIKGVFLSLVVLVLGERMTWEGRTLSEQVNQRYAKIEKASSVSSAKKWVLDLVSQVQSGLNLTGSSRTEENVSSRDQKALKKLIHQKS